MVVHTRSTCTRALVVWSACRFRFTTTPSMQMHAPCSPRKTHQDQQQGGLLGAMFRCFGGQLNQPDIPTYVNESNLNATEQRAAAESDSGISDDMQGSRASPAARGRQAGPRALGCAACRPAPMSVIR